MNRSARELFLAALELPESARHAFLTTACDGDEALRARVLALLEDFAQEDGFLDRPVDLRLLGRSSEGLTGRELGPYRVTRELGRGGMGRVYLAERVDEAFEKSVAIKVLDARTVAPALVQRFQAERQILASLEHPFIARLLDAGSTADGLLYLVMEHVDGQPIDRACDTGRLTVRARLELMRKVCAAVHYAHQNLVLHRDLKPSNLLVDRQGEPRLLDFGIARILDDFGPAALTETSSRALTPRYASPEQVAGQPLGTASDVYSLGVLLYELLTGYSPYRSRSGRSTLTPEEWLWAVVESAPLRPSLAVVRPPLDAGQATGVASREEIAACRATEPRRLERLLAGDLDTIVEKALHRDPARRYGSAAELADDLRRHLEGYPVLARPDTWTYRLGRFVRRKKAVSAAVAATVVFGLGMAVLAWQLEASRVRLEQERAQAEEVADFALSVFEQADPRASGAPEVSARRLLAQGEARLRAATALDDATRERMVRSLGIMARNVGDLERAEPLLVEALSLARRSAGADPRLLVGDLLELAELYRVRRERQRAEPLFEEALALARAELGPRSRETARALAGLGQLLVFHEGPPSGESAFREAIAILESHGETRGELYSELLHSLGRGLGNRREFGPARELLERAHAVASSSLGEDHPQTARIVLGLGILCFQAGDLLQAERMLRLAVDRHAALYGESDYRVLTGLDVLARVVGVQGRTPEAIAFLERALALARAQPGVLRRQPGLLLMLASERLARGELDRAESLILETGEILADEPSPHPMLGESLRTYRIELAREQGQLEVAEREARALVAERRAVPTTVQPTLSGALYSLARVLRDQGRADEALALVAEAEALDQGQVSPRDLRSAGPWLTRATILVRAGRLAEAAPSIAHVRRILDESQVVPASWIRGLLDSFEGRVQAAAGERERARELLERALGTLRATLGPAAAETKETAALLAQLR